MKPGEVDLRPGWRPRAPLLVAIAAGLAGVALGILIAADDVGGPQFAVRKSALMFALTLGAITATVGFFATERLLLGGRYEYEEWLLVLPAHAGIEGYRDPVPPRVGQLTARLGKLGYSLSVTGSDDGEGRVGDHPLADIVLFIHEETAHGQRSGIRLKLGPRSGVERALAFLEVWDGDDGVHAELAKFVIHELGNLLPGLEFKRSDSKLSPEPSGSLQMELPDYPRCLKE